MPEEGSPREKRRAAVKKMLADKKSELASSQLNDNIKTSNKAKQYESKKVTEFDKEIRAALGIDRYSNTKEMRKLEMEFKGKLKEGSLTEEDKTRFLDAMITEGIVINREKVNAYRELKSVLEDTTFNISETTKKNITDYKDFVKANKWMKLKEESVGNIDGFYNNELQAEYGKGLFPDMNTQEEMLERIADVYANITDVEETVRLQERRMNLKPKWLN